MNRFAALLLALPMVVANAQDGSSAFSEPPPDESSPFFVSGGLLAEKTLKTEIRNSPATQYPISKKHSEPGLGQVRSFFTGLIPTLHWGGTTDAAESSSLLINPVDPVLKDQRELAATYTVRNNSRQLIRLEFPTTQHIEILARNPSGAVVERWSDDRAFQNEEGIVILNPRERIEYRESISTREFRPGQTYMVEASLKSQPDEAVSQAVNTR